MRLRTAVALVGIAVLALSGLSYYRHLQRIAALRWAVPGGDGGGLPLAQPEDERLDGAALERASHDPAAERLAALMIMRHGHVVFERFDHGVRADTMIDYGASSRVLVALLAGVTVQDRALALHSLGRFEPSTWAAAIERAAHDSYSQLLSHRVWSRLNAAAGWIALPAPGAAVPADCCFHGRIEDWLRVGALLADGGRFEGAQIVAATWVNAMRQPAGSDRRSGLGVELPQGAHGAAAFAADDVIFLRGPGHWRLWLSPSLNLAVLFGDAPRRAASEAAVADGGAGSWDETRLPNLVIEALQDHGVPRRGESLLQQLVPQH